MMMTKMKMKMKMKQNEDEDEYDDEDDPTTVVVRLCHGQVSKEKQLQRHIQAMRYGMTYGNGRKIMGHPFIKKRMLTEGTPMDWKPIYDQS